MEIKRKAKDALEYAGKHKRVIASLGLTAAGVGVNYARKKAEDKHHEAQEAEIKELKEQHKKEYKSLLRKLNKIEKNQQKEFSIKGGKPGKKDPMSTLERAIRYTAHSSAFNLGDTRHAASEDIIPYFTDATVSSPSQYSGSQSLNLFYSGSVLVIQFSYLNDQDIKNLSNVLDGYCKSTPGTSYCSEMTEPGSYFIELYVVQGSEKELAYNLSRLGLKINIIK